MKNICHRCLLRLSNIDTPTLYAASPPHQAAPCPLCVGILQPQTLNILKTTLPNLLFKKSHTSTIKINSTLPLSAAQIRPRALTPPVQISLRQALKWSLTPILTANNLIYHPDAPLFLDLTILHPESLPDSNLTPLSPPSAKKPRPNPPSARELAALTDAALRPRLPPSFAPLPPTKTFPTLTAALSAAPLLLAGTYTKLARTVSQTPWYVDNPASRIESHPVRRTPLSVQDVAIRGISAHLRPAKVTFTAGGREDVDVRMLGTGRPFVVEVLDPCIVPPLVTQQMVCDMQAESCAVTDAVQIHRLRVVPKRYFAQMRLCEGEKRKCYRCVVWIEKPVPLDVLKKVLEVDAPFVLRQKTPLRVLHRRTLLVRERVVYDATVASLVSDNVFVLDLVAAAGTYVKEFVHGDNGRTVPNVAQLLGCRADILQLDVTQIHAADPNTIARNNSRNHT